MSSIRVMMYVGVLGISHLASRRHALRLVLLCRAFSEDSFFEESVRDAIPSLTILISLSAIVSPGINLYSSESVI